VGLFILVEAVVHFGIIGGIADWLAAQPAGNKTVAA